MAGIAPRKGPDRFVSGLFGVLAASAVIAGSIAAAATQTHAGLVFLLALFVGSVLAGLSALTYKVEDVHFRLRPPRWTEPSGSEDEQDTTSGWDSVWRSHDRQEGSG